jgi:hypothetical protein
MLSAPVFETYIEPLFAVDESDDSEVTIGVPDVPTEPPVELRTALLAVMLPKPFVILPVAVRLNTAPDVVLAEPS